MKTLICVAILVSICASALAGNWTLEDTAYQVVSTGIQVVDWGQTRYIARHPDRFYEMNPILGRHPSPEEVDVYSASSIAVKALISYALPPKWRRVWQVGNIAISAGLTIRNASLGIKVKF